MTFTNTLTAVENLSNQPDQANASVSEKGVYWHLDHSMRAIIEISKVLIASNPVDYQGNTNVQKDEFLANGNIPRGSVDAPETMVSPKDVVEKGDVAEQIATAKEALDKINALPEKSHFTYPALGPLTRDETMTFMDIHTRHHLKIIEEIKAG